MSNKTYLRQLKKYKIGEYIFMKTYHKINTIFKRDLSLKRKPLIYGEWSEK